MKKIAVINRAVSGSGKSTMARSIKTFMESKGISVAIHSSDELFMVDGEYRFSFEKLGYNHKLNFNNYCESLAQGVSVIICDNTNVKDRDAKNYVDMAKELGYMPIELYFEPSSVEEHIARNVHKVPESAIVAMVENLAQSKQLTLYRIGVEADNFESALVEVPEILHEYLVK